MVLDLCPGQEATGDGMYDPLAEDDPATTNLDGTDDDPDDASSTRMDVETPAQGATSSTADRSTTLVSSVAAGKRKVADTDPSEETPSSAASQLSVSIAGARSARSAPCTSSAASRADSGHGGSSKKRKSTKIGDTGTSMRSSRAQGSSAGPDFHDIREQQNNNMLEKMGFMLERNLSQPDPLVASADMASATVISGVLGFEGQDKVDLLQALTKHAESVNFFNGVASDIEVQRGYALGLLEDYRFERAARRSKN